MAGFYACHFSVSPAFVGGAYLLSLLYLRRPQRRSATNYSLVGRQMPRESNTTCQVVVVFLLKVQYLWNTDNEDIALAIGFSLVFVIILFLVFGLGSLVVLKCQLSVCHKTQGVHFSLPTCLG